jgi:ATP-dependent Clp protease, protease subunit
MRINVKGPIINDGDQWIYDWFGIPATSPTKVNAEMGQAVRNQSSELTVVINSGGGSVFSASEIYTALKSFKGNVKVEIVGIAASAASVIAMAGAKIEMSPTAQLMIHNAATGNRGDYRVMDHTSDFLQNVNKSIMNAYTAKTGKDESYLKNMMDNETWMTAQQALEHGFIDAIMFEQEKGAAANVEHPQLVNGILPQEVIDKVRSELLKDKSLSAFNSTQTPVINHPENEGKGKEQMDLEKLKNEHPELFEQVKNMGFEDGKKAENTRIKSIEELATPGNESLVQAAKFEDNSTAEELAVAIVKAEKVKGANFFQQTKADAEPLDEVPGSQTVLGEEKDAEVVAAFGDIWKGGKQ